MKRTLADIARLMHGELTGADRAFTAVSTDTRTLAPGELFIALSGPNFDGQQFVAQAHARGAAGAVVTQRQPLDLPQIVVPDTLRALQDAGRGWRARFSIPVVGVGGSNGKTTTKEMIAAVLGVRGPCLATRGNLNNHIGVPLTLLRMDDEHQGAVIEMGANRQGDIAELVALVQPGVAVVTNAGAEHLEGFGDLDGVAAGEGEMYAGLGPGAVAVINRDDRYAPLWRGMSGARPLVTFGSAGGADVTASAIRSEVVDGAFRQQFTLGTPRGTAAVVLGLAGRHNVTNALAAAAAAIAAGATLAEVSAGLARVRPVKGRLELKAAARGAWLLDDSYNANPSSVAAGLDVLADLPGEHWLVLGEMAELGAGAREAHIAAGQAARRLGVTRLFAHGDLTRLAVDAFGQGGEWFAAAEPLAARIGGLLAPGITVLVKGSRVNRLERVVEALAAPAARAG